jgi:CRISPR-associated protein Csa1
LKDTYILKLNEEANNIIKSRGYNDSVKVPSELSNPEWFLSVSDIAYSYCPTNRYIYLKKIDNKRPHPTWNSYIGKIIDDLLPDIYNKVFEYSNSKKPKDFNIYNDLFTFFSSEMSKYKDSIKPESFLFTPESSDIDDLFNDLSKLISYEIIIASIFLNHRISNNYDINLSTEVKILFPFDFKLKINALRLGISESAEIDFIYKQSLLGEIKSINWNDFYNVGLAGYALAYEEDRHDDINIGVVMCPLFLKDRHVPMYKNYSNLTVINEVWRKTFLTNRNNRIKIVRDKIDPGRPENNSLCKTCGYYKECWEK